VVLATGSRRHPVDPYPYSFLTVVVSFEAIFLAIFVLVSQNRLGCPADRRAHLDLHVNPPAEQESTLSAPPPAGPDLWEARL
jgi:uncharacterized membrane protein